MSSEVWRPGNEPLNEVDIRHGEQCPYCPALKKQRAIMVDGVVTGLANICNACGCVIPEYPNMGINGYQSFKIDHLHLTEMGVTHPGRKIINLRLCRACKALDYQAAYPNLPLPAEFRQ